MKCVTVTYYPRDYFSLVVRMPDDAEPDDDSLIEYLAYKVAKCGEPEVTINENPTSAPDITVGVDDGEFYEASD